MRSNTRQQRQRAIAQAKAAQAVDIGTIAIVSGAGLLGILAGLAALFH